MTNRDRQYKPGWFDPGYGLSAGWSIVAIMLVGAAIWYLIGFIIGVW